ncbi:MAG: AAA family ATPase [Rhodocyclaceae bacterium]
MQHTDSQHDPAQPDPLRLRFDAFELDERDARLTRNGEPIPLAPKAFDLLCALARQRGQLVTKDMLLDAVWGHRHVSESVLKSTISAVRAALSDDAKQPRFIETASRRGYRFIGTTSSNPSPGHEPVREATLAAHAAQPAPASSSTLIGRQAALDQLHGAWHKAASGQRQIMWLSGEAGIGKTTLIDHFTATLPDAHGVIRAHGQCVEQYGAGEPYLPVLEALASLCREDPALVALMRAVAPSWLMQLPWLLDDTQREALRQTRDALPLSQERMLRELGELFDRYTQDRPLLLVTEDLHWSDHATTHLIDHIARRRSPARFMWLVSLRLADAITGGHPLERLRHELRLHRLCHEIALTPFNEQEVAHCVEQHLAQHKPNTSRNDPAARNFIRSLHRHTGGLPLFLVSVLDDLATHSLATHEDSATHLDALPDAGALPAVSLRVPDNLAGVIGQQLERLTPEQQTLLEAASVCGVEFRAAILAAVLEHDPADTSARCDELVRAQRWLAAGHIARLPDGTLDARYVFPHALYRQVIHQRIGSLRRAQLHQRAAQALELSRLAGLPVTAAELASHYEASHDLVAAVRHLAEAAQSAQRHYAPAETLQLSTHGLQLLARCPLNPQSPERLKLELALLTPRSAACAALHGIEAPESRIAFERVHELVSALPDAGLRTQELTGLGWVFFARGDYEQAIALGTRLATLAEKRNDPLLQASACNLVGCVYSFQGNPLAGRQWLAHGAELCRDIGDQIIAHPSVVDLEVAMHARLSMPLFMLGHIDQARAAITTARERAERIGQPFARMIATYFGILYEIRLGNAREADTLCNTLDDIVTTHGLVQGEGPALWMRGWAIAQLGEPAKGYDMIMQGYARQTKLGTRGAGCAGVLALAASALTLMERWSEAQTHIDEGLTLATEIGEGLFLPDLHMLQARCASALGQAKVAGKAMQAALSAAREQHALWQELRVLVGLCSREGVSAETLLALKAACEKLEEGRDTVLAQQAEKLLAAYNKGVSHEIGSTRKPWQNN